MLDIILVIRVKKDLWFGSENRGMKIKSIKVHF